MKDERGCGTVSRPFHMPRPTVSRSRRGRDGRPSVEQSGVVGRPRHNTRRGRETTPQHAERPLLWNGLPTVSHAATEGLLIARKTETFGRGRCRGRETTTQRAEGPRLWNGLPTVSRLPTEGLRCADTRETFGRGQCCGRETTTQRGGRPRRSARRDRDCGTVSRPFHVCRPKVSVARTRGRPSVEAGVVVGRPRHNTSRDHATTRALKAKLATRANIVAAPPVIRSFVVRHSLIIRH